MPAVHVRELSREVVSALKRRAASHHRSLQKELRLLLVEAAAEAPPAEPLAPIRLKKARINHDATWSREVIYGDDGR